MASLNRVQLIGRLGKDPEIKKISNDGNVLNLSVATTELGKDNTKRTEWHRVVCFGKTAENINKYCKKGSQLYLEGRLQTREWSGKDGNKNYSTEIICNFAQFLDSKPQSDSQPAQQKEPEKSTFIGEDIPF